MAFQSRDVLTGWIADFERRGHPPVDARVLEQDGSQGADTGLVAVRVTGGLALYLQPVAPDSGRWSVTIESREEAVELSSSEVTALAGDLTTVTALCEFLEARSTESAT